MTFHPNIIQFIDARLREEESAITELLSEGDSVREKRLRELAFEKSVTDQIRHMLRQERVPATDHPLATGLLLLADVWREHPDFNIDLWFPTLLKGHESHGARRG